MQVHTDPRMELTAEERGHLAEIELRVPRGEILDDEGRVLAEDRQMQSLWANPRGVVDAEFAATVLSAKFGVDEADTAARLAQRDKDGRLMRFVWIKRLLSDDEVRTFENLDPLAKYGLELKKESNRYYPEKDLAAHIIGFVDRDGFGQAGIEKRFDKFLRSVPGKHKSRVDANRNMLGSRVFESIEPEGGDSIYLTIDKGIQRTLEQAIDKGMAESSAPQGMGIVVDVKTGAILAMACRPSYDPNVRGDVTGTVYRNRAVEFAFEPGSSFKIVAASAALEEGLITPDTMIDCEGGAFNPYGHRIRDFHRFGVIPFTKCFSESSNIAHIKLGAMLGAERFEHWMRRYGFGKRACADFPSGSCGILRPRSKWSRLSMGSLPMGQEVAVTMPQLARAFCVIASGGLYRDLHVVDRAVDRSGNVIYRHQDVEPERILSEATARTMQELCHLVVLHGTGKPASIPEYRVGGKTGTAQIAIPGGKGFMPGKFTAVFAGFAPVADPRICCVIVIQEPAVKLHFGGTVSGPVFKEVVRDALIKLNCPQDPTIETKGGESEGLPLPEQAGEDEDTLVARADDEADLLQEPQVPLDGLELVAASKAPDTGEPLLPSFVGLTKRQAKEYVDTLGINWDPQGAGRVVSQDPPPGTALRDVALCRLVFSSTDAADAPQPQATNDATKPASSTTPM